MYYVVPGHNFSFNYATFDQDAGLYVLAQIYDLTTGTAVFVTSVQLTEVFAGVYSGALFGKRVTLI